MIAILSDIHGNLEALEAVLADAVSFNVDRIVCLGDLIGYGPDPIPCVERAMEWHFTLLGHFEDAAVLGDDLPGWGSPSAKKTVFRFRDDLHKHPRSHEIANFLMSLPTQVVTSDALYVHGSPRESTHEYLFPEDSYNARKMDAMAQRFESLCFCGHTHLPGIFHQKGSSWDYSYAADCNYRYMLREGKILCNVGSVGQPRDLEPRACYVLFSPGEILYRRVEYDRELTIQKLRDRGYDDIHGQRLREGR